MLDNSLPVVLVTGASRGLGRGIALQLAENGYSVAINYTKNKTAADETVLNCQKKQISENQQFIHSTKIDVALSLFTWKCEEAGHPHFSIDPLGSIHSPLLYQKFQSNLYEFFIMEYHNLLFFIASFPLLLE